MKPLAECLLYTFVDTAYLGGRNPAEIAQQLCDGGSDLIQLRAKGALPDEVRRLAEAVQPIIQRAGVGFVLNDHWDLACGVGADVCHLGQEDFFDTGFSKTSRPSKPQLGLSTHAPDQAERAIAAHPDYIAIGPVFATPTKPQAPAVTLEYVRWAKANIQIPWFAIGGIKLANAPLVIAAGATRLCVVSEILLAPDPAQKCRDFRRLLEGR